MRLDQLLAYFGTSPALKLLRAQHAPFVIDFLHRQFKVPGRISLPASDLVSALTDYRESVQATHPDALRDKPEHYLSSWCSGETRWLHRSVEGGRNEPVFQLTPHTEDVFLFLDRALQKDLGFVGTESRLRVVISTLADLVAGASHDPEVRLAHLREERTRIDDEIGQILRDGGVEARYEPAAVRERFATAVGLLKELLSDFRSVEDRFKEITRQVQRRQLDGKDSRGEILQFALDAEDVLKQDDQGVSFYEFVRFILSPTQQEKLQTIIAELGRIDELSQQSDGLATVRRMVPSLIADAEKVMRTNQRLSATLRRLLDVRTASDRRRVTQLLADIRGLGATLADVPPADISATVDVGVQMAFPFSRTFWSPPTEFAKMDLSEGQVDDARRVELFRMLAQLHRLDWAAMRQRIRALTSRTGRSMTLSEVVREFPPEAGIVELLGYIQIAKDDGHIISRERSEDIQVDGAVPRRVTVPLIVFLPPQEAANA
jgi:hypothetical protein